jgi:hypothetical protein
MEAVAAASAGYAAELESTSARHAYSRVSAAETDDEASRFGCKTGYVGKRNGKLPVELTGIRRTIPAGAAGRTAARQLPRSLRRLTVPDVENFDLRSVSGFEADFLERASEMIKDPTAFQADDEGPIPFTRSNDFNYLAAVRHKV